MDGHIEKNGLVVSTEQHKKKTSYKARNAPADYRQLRMRIWYQQRSVDIVTIWGIDRRFSQGCIYHQGDMA